jgi:hypothetical protein
MGSLVEALHQASTHGHALRLNSSRSLPGKPFAPGPELALGSAVEHLSLSLSRAHKGLFIIDELPGPLGVVDFAVVIPHVNRLYQRLGSQVPALLNEADALIVSTLYETRPLSVKTITDRTGLSLQTVNDRTSVLRRRGALIAATNSTFVRHSAIMPVGRIHVFETKIGNWRRAADQAYVYASWSDTTSITLDRIPADSNVLNETPAWMGVAAGSSWKRKPRIRENSKARRLWASEHVVAALPGYQSSFVA